MMRVFAVVEGETEERFLRSVVQPYLIVKGIFLDAQQWYTNPRLGSRGGGSNFDHAQNHVNRLLSRYARSNDVYITTMVDLYAFPKQGNTIWSEEVAKSPSGVEKARILERTWSEKVQNQRFIPYVQVHEFETLLLSNPDVLKTYFIKHHEGVEALKAAIGKNLPEEVNDTPEGAPSKRITQHVPVYKSQKTTAGISCAKAIGLYSIRQKCPNFDKWISALENLA